MGRERRSSATAISGAGGASKRGANEASRVAAVVNTDVAKADVGPSEPLTQRRGLA